MCKVRTARSQVPLDQVCLRLVSACTESRLRENVTRKSACFHICRYCHGLLEARDQLLKPVRSHTPHWGGAISRLPVQLG